MESLNKQSVDVTELLTAWGKGDSAAGEELLPLVYDELKRLARAYLKKERADQTLQTTDLVHEAYVRLVNQRRVNWQNRAHFYGIAAQLMRRLLIDRARARRRAKRGAGAERISLNDLTVATPAPTFDFIAFDEALTKLAFFDQRKAKIVELRFFGGLTVEETALFLDVSEITVMRDWKMAKTWLHKALT